MDADQFAILDISDKFSLLVPGRNVLTVHGLNRGRVSSDFIIRPIIVASQPAGGELGSGVGVQLLQVQNSNGLFSNDYIFFAE